MTNERTATLRIGRWSSSCSACGGNADPHEERHVHGGPKSMWDDDSTLSKTNGCGALFTEREYTYTYGQVER